MSLSEYKRKRHFRRTPEPEGKQAKHQGSSFVVQKHDASHLHYDFRLEMDGVLKSWAVPKGPSLDPTQKRLAVQVEDHPVAYGGFEGTIPEGEYGGGTVMLWDRGEWTPDGDPSEAYRRGKLKFQLHGDKLHGGWLLIRRAGAPPSSGKHAWFLMKRRDEEAKSLKEGDIVKERPLSVVSGRDLDEIAAAKGRIGKSKPGRKRKPTAKAHARDEFHGVRLTSPDKVMYPEQGITKFDLAAYYYQIADWILPHVAGRPLVLVRCPEGRDDECFYQKHPRIGTPKNLRQIPVKEKSRTEPYLVVDDMPGLISLVQIGSLEIHAWGSRADNIERPDRLIFDLDPDPAVKWARVVESAKQIRQFLEDLGLVCFVKTTGGKGLHLVVPIQRRHDWDEAKQFCKSVAETIVAADPDRYTSNMSKAARRGKIFIDYLRNARGATSVAAYSTRAKSGAPVSVPLSWQELSPTVRSDQFNTTNLPQRLASLKKDPWAGIDFVRQSLSARVKKKLSG